MGAGAWGTALSVALRRAGRAATLWARENAVASDVNVARRNRAYLPGIDLDPAIRATCDLRELADCDALLLAVPAQHLRRAVAPLELPASTPLVVCAKGIERETRRLMSEAVSEAFPSNPVLVLSGPTFAREVAAGLPAAATLAGADAAATAELAASIASERFRPYTSDDVVGAQIGGAVKNVLAIACGISEGFGFGHNARAALVTRGLAELTRLCVAKGGRAETMAGLSGLGDLVLTCTSEQSRNYSLGLELGRGRSLEDALGERNSVTEGVYTAAAASALAAELGVDMPIADAVDAVLNRGAEIERVVEALLSRPIRTESARGAAARPKRGG